MVEFCKLWKRPRPDPPAGEIERFFQYYATTRAYVLAESTLIGNRLTWIITINGFLFASAGLIIQQRMEHADFWVRTDALLGIVCIVAIAINILGWFTIHAAQRAGEAVNQIFLDTCERRYAVTHARNAETATIIHGPGGYDLPGIRGGGELRNVTQGHRASRWIPRIFAYGWLLIIACCIGFEFVQSQAATGCNSPSAAATAQPPSVSVILH
jgi:hypothetical protein